MEDRRLKTGDGRQQMGDRQQEMGDGRQEMVEGGQETRDRREGSLKSYLINLALLNKWVNLPIFKES